MGGEVIGLMLSVLPLKGSFIHVHLKTSICIQFFNDPFCTSISFM
jgi:hypothetical protein